ncbi:MAG: hypothetical protein A3F84_18745 [Candidatus Handelsmanbacteria bacterium RIFCSPLOWO2_12_FULL_64_10]|uniref:ABC transporter permease n=1 Tax=Handelsmanbacteria sp. (strain RIFCSPLOWO2_12_FULL_64_10) TaxID=1817868 RepID=A0A1F6D231_HANXR|nr:MAG: hypothetical protein A3F84_18745 [Candidatus Handelsmanbacteria bacterium RIFCSPLOWO2_12_FULL_64_10]
MFSRLVQKELLHHLLDFRFIAVFALCALLSVLSVYAGTRTYLYQLQEYNTISERNQRYAESFRRSRSVYWLKEFGFSWSRRPEALSTVVYGLSGPPRA